MQYHSLLWQALTTVFVKYWRTEVTAEENAQQITPIRFHGDPSDIYLA